MLLHNFLKSGHAGVLMAPALPALPGCRPGLRVLPASPGTSAESLLLEGGFKETGWARGALQPAGGRQPVPARALGHSSSRGVTAGQHPARPGGASTCKCGVEWGLSCSLAPIIRPMVPFLPHPCSGEAAVCGGAGSVLAKPFAFCRCPELCAVAIAAVFHLLGACSKLLAWLLPLTVGE